MAGTNPEEIKEVAQIEKSPATKEERAIWYGEQMAEKVHELKMKIPELSDEDVADLIEENIVTTRFFKQVYDTLVREKIDRQIRTNAEAKLDLTDLQGYESGVDKEEEGAVEEPFPKLDEQEGISE